jgi:hypothetical protein
MVSWLDQAFDESALGFASFPDLVAAMDGRIVERAGRFDHELAVRADLPAPSLTAPGQPGPGLAPAGSPQWPGSLYPPTPAARVEAQLKRKQRLPADKQLLWMVPGLIAEIFASAPDGIVASFASLWCNLDTAAAATGIAVSETEFRKVKGILWRAYAFEPVGRDQGLRLRARDAAELRLRTVATLLRMLPDPAAADPAVLAEALFGPAATAEQRDLIRAALVYAAEHPYAGIDPGPACLEDAVHTDADCAACPKDADCADADCRDEVDAQSGDRAAESARWENAA